MYKVSYLRPVYIYTAKFVLELFYSASVLTSRTRENVLSIKSKALMLIATHTLPQKGGYIGAGSTRMPHDVNQIYMIYILSSS